MEDKIFKTLTEYLINQESKKLVGKVLQRFDIVLNETYKTGKEEISTKELKHIKADVKELMYEWLRDFRDSLNTGKFILKISKENPQSKE